ARGVSTLPHPVRDDLFGFFNLLVFEPHPKQRIPALLKMESLLEVLAHKNAARRPPNILPRSCFWDSKCPSSGSRSATEEVRGEGYATASRYADGPDRLSVLVENGSAESQLGVVDLLSSRVSVKCVLWAGFQFWSTLPVHRSSLLGAVEVPTKLF